MHERRRILLLIVIMLGVALSVGGITLQVLYRVAFEQQRERLVETAQSQARLLEAVARFDKANYGIDRTPEETFNATLSQIQEAHEQFEEFGNTGEFNLARLEGDQIVFLLNHRHYDMDHPHSVPFESDLAEPMRRALSGESGTVVGLDYRGVTVLAAYEPVAEYDLGIVAKIDMEEVRAPFIRAGLIVSGLGLLFVVLGAVMFWAVSNPLLRQLEAREMKYRTLFEHAHDAIFIVDPETQRFMDVNENAAQRLGYTKDELLQLTLSDIYAPAAMKRNIALIRELQAQGSVVFEHVQRRKDGTEMTVEVSSRVIAYDNQRVMQSIVRDITARKAADMALRNSEERFRGMVEHSHDAIRLVDVDGTIIEWNRASEELTGLARGEVIGRKVWDVEYDMIPPERRTPELKEAIRTGTLALLTHGDSALTRQTLERDIIAADGTRKMTQWALFDIPRGDQFILCGITRDITEERRVQEERMQLRLEQDRMRMLTGFVEAVSHEFRTPLAVIYTGVEVLERIAEANTKVQPWAAQIKEYALYLGELIDVMLTMSRLDSSVQLTLESVQLHTILTGLYNKFEHEVQSKQHTLHTEHASSLPLVRADTFDLHMALGNMLDNALRFTPEGGTITVRTRHEGTEVIVEIMDTGTGIDPEHLPHIFERFYRADQARTTRHVGMGLAIAQRVIALHDGRIEVESVPGEGSTFRVVLPVDENTEE